MFGGCAYCKCQHQLFAPFGDAIGTYSQVNAMSCDIDSQPLDVQLKSRDHVSVICLLFECTHGTMQYLISIACNISGDQLVRHLMIQIDSINFALDWALKWQQPGGKTYKSDFAKAIYEAQTGCQPPLKTASKVDHQLFKSFKF